MIIYQNMLTWKCQWKVFEMNTISSLYDEILLDIKYLFPIQIVSKKYPETIWILSGQFDQMDNADIWLIRFLLGRQINQTKKIKTSSKSVTLFGKRQSKDRSSSAKVRKADFLNQIGSSYLTSSLGWFRQHRFKYNEDNPSLTQLP